VDVGFPFNYSLSNGAIEGEEKKKKKGGEQVTGRTRPNFLLASLGLLFVYVQLEGEGGERGERGDNKGGKN